MSALCVDYTPFQHRLIRDLWSQKFVKFVNFLKLFTIR